MWKKIITIKIIEISRMKTKTLRDYSKGMLSIKLVGSYTMFVRLRVLSGSSG